MAETREAETDLIGMWLFLATEVLFFGALFFVYVTYQGLYPQAMAAGVKHTDLTLGTINTVLLVTSSLLMTIGVGWPDWMKRAFAGAGGFGIAFLVIKGCEYAADFKDHLFPDIHFADGAGPEKLFFVLYFIATSVHAIHMLIGLGMIALVIRGRLSPVMVGLYWSFVDIVWICLYPLLYLVGRGLS